MAACVGVVSLPRSWAASETESASGRPPRCSVTSRSASRIWAPRWRRWTSASFRPVRCRSQRKNGSVGSRSVLAEPAGDLEVSLLEHVRVVDPARQPAAEPQAHHPLEPVAVAGEQVRAAPRPRPRRRGAANR